MVFSSHLFLFYFLPVTLLIYYASPQRFRHLLLTVLSYVFYGWANPYFFALMFGTSLVDYFVGLAMADRLGRRWREPIEQIDPKAPHTRQQRIALCVSIISNLLSLGFFKYFNFGVDSYNGLVRSLGLDPMVWDTAIRITLPLGISFYTIQSMSYTIDVFRGQAKAIRNFTDFSCFVSMFPQLVAGPIVRFQDVADQLAFRTHTVEKFARGVSFVCCGLAKKILIANACGKIADTCFNASGRSVIDAWYGTAAYAFQIYFDFSGYSDMAIGLGLMLGFVFLKNFDAPYRSKSITEFWRRWHLSLSNCLRDYLYIPLGGNRKGELRTYINLALVMLIGGMWHGASWNFIIWGGIQGVVLSAERMLGKESFYHKLPGPFQVSITFLITCIAWVFFRAATLPDAMGYLASMFGAGSHGGSLVLDGLIYKPYYLLTMAAAAVIVWGTPQTWEFTRKLTWPKAAWCASLLLVAITVMTTQSFNPFIYFIF